jgi:hypothetical protein
VVLGAAGGRGAGFPYGRRRRLGRAAGAARRTSWRSGAALLGAKTEWIKTFADPFAIDRAEDDQDEGDAATAAEELAEPTLQRGGPAPGGARALRPRPAQPPRSDDLPLGPGEQLPEWDGASQRLLPRACWPRPGSARQPPPWQPPPALRAQARAGAAPPGLPAAAPRWQRGQPMATSSTSTPGCAMPRRPGGAAARRPCRRARQQRDLATLLLADLSLSTDAHANNEQRVIDVIRDALYVFGEALHGQRRRLRHAGLQLGAAPAAPARTQGFRRGWNAARARPPGRPEAGYYTRMGAALRAATQRLAARPERQRLLLLLTDGKPNDLDGYEGRWAWKTPARRCARRAPPACCPLPSPSTPRPPRCCRSCSAHKGWPGCGPARRPAAAPGPAVRQPVALIAAGPRLIRGIKPARAALQPPMPRPWRHARDAQDRHPAIPQRTCRCSPTSAKRPWPASPRAWSLRRVERGEYGLPRRRPLRQLPLSGGSVRSSCS